ncbi:hypothetical protein [Coprobacter fastidiosus]|uniref:hypothetical protein n=1 Tax=Coprobacter fastidiosus TaxID=1099853 RepID=UPI003A91B2C1
MLTKVFIFTMGAAVGSLVTWKIVKTKYEKIAQEEIDSVKEVFSRKENQIYEHIIRENSAEEHKIEAKPDLQELAEQIKTLKYVIEAEEKSEVKDRPYVISAEEFGQADDDYDIVSLNYYADEVLTDDFDIPIVNADDVVGLESFKHFGEYVEDVVYVRNDKLKAEYEIVRMDEKYSDIVNNNSHQEEEE